MPFGSIFSKFESIDLETADGHSFKLKNNFLTRIAFRIFGMPHLGVRLRARKIIKNIPPKTKEMLDAGCGSGIYSFSLSNKFQHIEAIDIENKKISYAKKINPFSNISFKQRDLTNLKYKNNKFDLVICSDVLEHTKEDKKAFSEIARVLKKGGTLLLTLPYNSKKNKKVYKRYGHERAGYTEKGIKKLCAKNNLTLIKSEGYSFSTADKLSEFSYRIAKSKALLTLLFYPLYLISLISESIKKGEPNGIFFKIKKN